MSWLFSQALVAEYLAGTCSDGELCAPLSGSPTQQAYLPPDRMTAFSRPSRFGMTFRPLTADLGEAVLTSYLAAFPAKTSALPAKEQESPESAAECGPTWRGSLARFDPVTASWRTAQPSLLGDSDESSVIWPRSGMTAGGQCWERPTLEHRISGTGFGLSPTPCADDSGTAKPSINQHWTKNGTLRHIGKDGRKSQVKLGEMVLTVAKWPTPVATMSKGSSPASLTRKDGRDRSGDRLDHAVMASNGGQLNPTWVEWLMGWPLGWTDLKPLVTDKSPCAPQQRGDS